MYPQGAERGRGFDSRDRRHWCETIMGCEGNASRAGG
jgi:hypothetical protein